MHGIFDRDPGDVLDAETSRRMSARLRQARQMRGMTLRTLADATGCSESLLSKIENSKAFPSLPMLCRLVEALATSIGWVFDDHTGKAPIIYRAGEAPALPVVDQPITLECIIPDAGSNELQANIVHVEAGASSEGEQRHAGEETGYLLGGEIELLIDGRPHRLKTGDAFAFHADQPHSFRNIGSSRATVFWVNTHSVM